MADQQWRLLLIENDSEGRINRMARGTLETCLDRETISHHICGDDYDMADIMIADLSRVGARYSEYIGGTVILAGID